MHAVQRRRWSIAEKVRMVEETYLPGMSVSHVARTHGVAPNLLFRWRKLMVDGGKTAIDADDQVISAAEARALKKQIRELERMLGKKTMEVEILRDMVELAREKKLPLAVSLVQAGRYPMKRIAEAAGVSRSQLIARTGTVTKHRACRYSKADDEVLLPLILEIMGSRQTYGYRRMCAVLNRKLEATGRSLVNHKRVYRIMRQNGLLLARHTGTTTKRAHTGVVAVPVRNTRWCSDGFEFTCDDGQRVRIAFALDACDREVIAFVATTGGISSSMVKDLMLECVEKRFGSWHAPHSIEWLSDNGSCYTASETRAFAAQLNLRPCFTPIRSPESNGLAEAFVKTFKRDYVFTHELSDAQSVLTRLAEWFEDYNEMAPHKALRMLSPREFIRKAETTTCPV
ncbi:IS3 family transposase [Desulfovibrio sp. OttesenSCG-928-G15]|nr:IS3 family transposase [Desulfovibrio sp. OttesenSCG-928-G15]